MSDDIPNIPPITTSHYIMISKSGLQKWKNEIIIEYLEKYLSVNELLIVERNILCKIIDKLKKENEKNGE